MRINSEETPSIVSPRKLTIDKYHATSNHTDWYFFMANNTLHSLLLSAAHIYHIPSVFVLIFLVHIEIETEIISNYEIRSTVNGATRSRMLL